jgi:UPF0755 protein
MASKSSSRNWQRTKGKGSPKTLRWVIGILIAALIVGGYLLLFPNTGSFSKDEFLYIRTGSDYDDVKQALEEGDFVKNMSSFDFLAKRAGYPGHVRPGKYRIPAGANNLTLVRLLRSGRQTPVKLVIGKLRTTNDFIRAVSSQLEADSTVLRKLLNDPVYLAQFGLKPATALCAVFPDTYEFYWNTSADKAYRKIAKTASKFWTPARQNQAHSHGMSTEEAMTLASIVDEETNSNPEKPLIASVYLNRLKKGMRLQADPTARYAAGDFSIKRVTEAQTSIASPYNTYAVSGLPPGPICTPSRASVDAVLKAPANSYLYFCAKEDFSGTHRFAATYPEHMRNARLFQAALNARNIH